MPEDPTVDSTPTEAPSPAAEGIETDDPTTQWTVQEILEEARTPETTARFCLRADLQAEHDQLVADLATMIDAKGKLIEDEDASLGSASTARAKVARLNEVQALMRSSMRAIRFRGMPSDELTVFEKKWLPEDRKPQEMKLFNFRLAAATAIAPELTLDELQKLTTRLGAPAIIEIVRAARAASYAGGVDLPKSPTFLAGLQPGSPENS